MKKNCIIRVDGNNLIGHGHIRRCLALTEALYNFCNIYVVTKKISNDLKKEFLQYGVNFLFLRIHNQSAINEAEYILNKITNIDLAIFDGYNFNSKSKKVFRKKNIKIITIDDEAKNYLLSDCVINHAPNISSKKFQKINGIDLRLGLDYLMVQNCFYKNKRNLVLHKKTKNNIFIALGSSEIAQQLVLKILNKLINSNYINKIFIVSSKDKNLNKIPAIKNSTKKVSVYSSLSAKEMSRLMHKSKIGICTSSTVALECCVQKLPLIVGYLAENQKNIYRGLIELKMAHGIGKFNKKNIKKIDESLINLLSTNKSSELLMKSQIKNIDNLSHIRLKKSILLNS